MRRKKFDEETPEEGPEEPKTLKDLLQTVEITPLRDFHIVQDPFDIELFEGVSVPIPPKFLKNMVTEGVIKEIPNIE